MRDPAPEQTQIRTLLERIGRLPLGDEDEARAIQDQVKAFAARNYGEDSRHLREASNIMFHPVGRWTPEDVTAMFQRGTKRLRSLLETWSSDIEARRQRGTDSLAAVIEQIHPDLRDAIISRVDSGHYVDAISEAFKVARDRVRSLSGLTTDGLPLMEEAFGGDDPLIKLTPMRTQSEKSEQRGFALIFQGVALGVRNPKSHDRQPELERPRAGEYISLLSLLMRRLDDADALRKAADS